ncbi:MAG: 3-oxoacyl-ACP synthase [Flavobacteriales bacterium]|jgi:hypothetical protein|nr:3-oxoacyl-ACP synthase [Candidatus Arcticimaribacter sp.]|tara:strand:- start:9101 stop:9547 length:447 start_codon:yes stop_codon:yes gene_type:complete
MLTQNLFNHCKNELTKKLKVLEARKRDLNQNLFSGHKSSAGDKHETERAMIQLELEKLGEQIKNTEIHQQILCSIQKIEKSPSVRLGSVVLTNIANYYISIAAGSCTLNSKTYYCISAQSPIGSLLLGKKVGDSIQFNNQMVRIEEII